LSPCLLQISSSFPQALQDLFASCLQTDPDARPTMETVDAKVYLACSLFISLRSLLLVSFLAV
jgi:hypothetical protein